MAKVGDLVPYAKNSRTHTEAQVRQIANSFKKFGMINPVVIDGENGIMAGHGRVLAAELLGMDEIPTVEADWLSEEEKRAYVIADNKLSLNAGWDYDLLQQELQGLNEVDFDIGVTGFDDQELRYMLEGGQKIVRGIDDRENEWEGMPEFDNQDLSPHRQMIVSFKSDADVDAFAKLIGQQFTDRTRSIWFPEEERLEVAHMSYVTDDSESDE